MNHGVHEKNDSVAIVRHAFVLFCSLSFAIFFSFRILFVIFLFGSGAVVKTVISEVKDIRSAKT